MASTATNETKYKAPEALEVGATVFHPAHGVAEVAGIERRVVGEERPEFYVLELAVGGTLLLPMHKVKQSGVRELISEAHARKLLKVVTTRPQADRASWRERAASHADALRDGAADGYTETLRQLLFRSTSNNLSMTETRQLTAARSFFVAEISSVLGQPAEQIEAQLLAVTDGDSKPAR